MNILKKSFNLVAILISSILLINCENQNSEISQETELLFDYNIDYGKIHNDGLEEYYNKYSMDKTASLSLIFERLNEINNKNNLKKTKVSSVKMNEFAEFFVNSKSRKTKNIHFSPNLRFIELLDFFENKDFYSPKVTNLLKGFIQNNTSAEEVIREISNIRDLGNISKEDDNVLYAFSSIYVASDQFWSKKESENKINYAKSSSDCNPKWQVRLADAAGGIFGAMFGSALAPGLGTAIGASVGSQGMSALIEKQQDDRGGKCVY